MDENLDFGGPKLMHSNWASSRLDVHLKNNNNNNNFLLKITL